MQEEKVYSEFSERDSLIKKVNEWASDLFYFFMLKLLFPIAIIFGMLLGIGVGEILSQILTLLWNQAQQ